MTRPDAPELRRRMTQLLDVGQLLMENGAETERTFATIKAWGAALECRLLDALVLGRSITITAALDDDDTRTMVREYGSMHVNLTVVSAISRITGRLERGEITAKDLEGEIERVRSLPRHYNRWLTIVMIGAACASFCKLLGGDWAAMAATALGSAVALFVRQELAQRHFNLYLCVAVSAFFAASISGLLAPVLHTDTLGQSIAASVLFLIPGVPFLNAAEDLLKGYPTNGTARAAVAAMIVLGIALGLFGALHLVGVSRL